MLDPNINATTQQRTQARQSQGLPAIYALAALIDQQRRQGGSGNPLDEFGRVGAGIVPKASGDPRGPIPGPGQLSVPDDMNPAFPIGSEASAPVSPYATPPRPPQPRPAPPAPAAMPPGGGASTLRPGLQGLASLISPATTGSIGGSGGAPVPPPTLDPDAPGPLGRMMPSGLRNGLVDALSALGGLDPMANPLQALGQGFAGAHASQQGREDRRLAQAGANYARDYKLYRDQVGDRRDDRRDSRDDTRLTLEERRDARRDQLDAARLGLEGQRSANEEKRLSIEERRAAREQRKEYIDEFSTAAGIKLTEAQTAKINKDLEKSGLDDKVLHDIEGEVSDHMKQFMPPGALEAVDPESDQGKRLLRESERFRKERLDYYKTRGEGSGSTPTSESGGPGAGTSSPNPGTSYHAPASPPDWSGVQALPKGSFYRLPADYTDQSGKVHKKGDIEERL